MENILVQVSSSLVNAINTKIDSFIILSPYILGAVAVALFGWILAEIAARAIIALGHKVKLEWLADKIGLKHFLHQQKSKLSPSEVIANGVKGYLIFLFLIEATKVAQLTQVAEFLSSVINFIPDVIIALFIMLVGIRIGHTVQLVISSSLSFAKEKTANVLGIAAKSTIVTFSILAALSQLNIAQILVQTLFIGFIAMLVVAGGLAFGLGGKDVVHELLEDIKKVELRMAGNSQKKRK